MDLSQGDSVVIVYPHFVAHGPKYLVYMPLHWAGLFVWSFPFYPHKVWRSAGVPPSENAVWPALGPGELDVHYIEPILVGPSAQLGAEIRFDVLL